MRRVLSSLTLLLPLGKLSDTLLGRPYTVPRNFSFLDTRLLILISTVKFRDRSTVFRLTPFRDAKRRLKSEKRMAAPFSNGVGNVVDISVDK